jgi:hypothetical protein
MSRCRCSTYGASRSIPLRDKNAEPYRGIEENAILGHRGVDQPLGVAQAR